MKIVTSLEAQRLRRAGLAYAEIGRILGIPKGTAYRLVKKPSTYYEYVGNKKRGFRPIWDFVSGEWLYSKVEVIANRYRDEFQVEALKDFLLDFAYTVKLDRVCNPEGYMYIVLCRKVNDFRRRYDTRNVRSIEEVQSWKI